MKPSLCPRCGAFALEFKPAELGKQDRYVCAKCGFEIAAEDHEPILHEDNMNRFPSGKDATPESNLSQFMKGKKQ